jgi:uncharacterized peroxidase-related enzyme
MNKFTVPTKENVSENNQSLFDNLQKALGFVPNMYAFFAHSPSALGDYLSLQNRKSSLSLKEKEVINLVVSQLNGCNYCKAAHTEVGKMVGFTEEQTLEIRKGNISFNSKLNALVRLIKEIVEEKGEASEVAKASFFDEGYTTENLVDVVMTVGDKIISNYLFALVKVPIDFPEPQEI